MRVLRLGAWTIGEPLTEAQRGDLAFYLPVGSVRDERRLVFAAFLEVKAVGKVAMALDWQGLHRPR